METEDLVLDHCCQRQVVKQVSQVLPHVGIAILAEALVIEAVDLGDLATLVVATEDSDTLLKAHFKADEKRDGLHTVVSTVNVITHEKIVCIRGSSSDFEKLHQVMELSVDITTDRHWASHWLHVLLLLQDLFRLSFTQ